MTADLEFSFTKSGLSVIRHHGRQLCGFINPVKEAEEWVWHYDDLLFKREGVIVLGLGAGFHVDALAQRFFGRILVVEKVEALIHHFHRAFPHLNGVVEVVSDSEEGFYEKIKSFPRPFSVLTFAPAVFSFKEDYQRLFFFLNGRSDKDIEKQYQLRTSEHFFVPEGLSRLRPAEVYKKLAHDHSVNMRWRTLFRMMGELIK